MPSSMYASTPQGGSWLSQGNNKWIVAIGGVVGLVAIFFILGRGNSGGGVTSGGQSSTLSDDISQLNDLIAGLGAGGGGGGGGGGGTGFTGGNPGDAIYTPPFSPTQPPSNSPYPGYGTVNPTNPSASPIAPTPVANPFSAPVQSPTGGISAVGPVINPANPPSYSVTPKQTVTSTPKASSPTYIPSPSLVSNPGNVGYPASSSTYGNTGTKPATKPVPTTTVAPSAAKANAVVTGATSSSVDKATATAGGFGGGGGWQGVSPNSSKFANSAGGSSPSSKEQNKTIATTSASVKPKPAVKTPITGVPKTSTKAI